MYIDFSKAFDKLAHSVIVNACFKIGLDSLIVSWIITCSSFLNDRKQRVVDVCNGSSSVWIDVSSGVPISYGRFTNLSCVLCLFFSAGCFCRCNGPSYRFNKLLWFE